jgi:glycosyltransferase involved in cell wall biosynthesis
MFVDKPLPSERPTGIGVASFNMALALSRRKNEVYFVCRGMSEDILTPNEYLTVRKITRFTRQNPFVALETLRNGRFDIFHIHSSSALISLLLGRMYGRIVICHAHGIEPLNPATMAIRRGMSMNIAQFVVAITENVKQELAKLYHIPLRKIVVVHNGVDSEEFRPLPKSPTILSKYDLQGFSRLILSVGALRGEKGQLRVIECLPQVLKRWPGLGYAIAGAQEDESYSRQVLERAQELGVAESVKLLGVVPRNELISLINSADLCVHPSAREGSANDLAILEEMACGKAVVAYSRDQSSWTIDDNVNGMIVRSEEIEVLRNSLLAVLETPELADKFGRAAREKAVSEFTWDETAKRLEDVYLQCSGQESKRGLLRPLSVNRFFSL